ncbi:hypothetical protein EPA93_47800 [Ktedonosporobacter rubrisoli]|uniref:HTH luxR-type domain-containing protein n=1 Tax=Ktedonosporobacter rubrisoli TaxID=2509675 RepID=A0A4P6K5L6_KTERU|nr:LuxR C-terminal-related transcriptional regulator [Ktedonosporobacter rubrisoli]QBD83263.1 hypothetical protein EPA93_47800 [Ktedonosporobacter rubrisoli]
MARRRVSHIINDQLVPLDATGRELPTIRLDTPEWYRWLNEEQTRSFAFHNSEGTFTARKERMRGHHYWYAYRSICGRSQKAYLGKTEALTLQQLQQVNRSIVRTSSATALKPAPANGVRFSNSLLITKLGPPRLPTHVIMRRQLLQQLMQVNNYRLFLLSAPAGFGKTTLLSTWAHQTSQLIAWISLDAGDNDPSDFWSYILHALNTLLPGIAETALAMLQLPQPPQLSTILTSLINALQAVSQEIVVLLDDYHLITAQPIHTSLAFLLEHIPTNLHLVIASRTDPQLPLSRMRAQGHLLEIGTPDLRFSRAEIELFFSQRLKQALSDKELRLLETRTEGWITGLQLAALSLRGQDDSASFIKNFTGSHHYVFTYLVQEVLALQPAHIQHFLLHTAILERLEGELCDAITGQQESQAILAHLEQANLFLIPLDDNRRWFRYHHLFAEALYQRLQQLYPQRIPELQRKASIWYEQHKLYYEATTYALAAQDFERAASLVEQIGLQMLQRGEMNLLARWVLALPEQVRFSSPRLLLFEAWYRLINGDMAAAERLIQDIETLHYGLHAKGLISSPGLPAPENLAHAESILVGEVIAMRSSLARARGDVAATFALAQQSLPYFPENSHGRSLLLWHLGLNYMAIGNPAAAIEHLKSALFCAQRAGSILSAMWSAQSLAQLQKQQGHLYQAEQSYQQIMQMIHESPGSIWITEATYLGLAELYYEWNALETAERFLHIGQTEDTQLDILHILPFKHLLAVRLKLAHNQLDEALLSFQKLGYILQEYAHILNFGLNSIIRAEQASLALDLKDMPVVFRWLETSTLSIHDKFDHLELHHYLVMARVLLSLERHTDAEFLLERLRQFAEEHGYTGKLISILVLQASCLQARSNTASALKTLARALSLAEKASYIRTLIDQSPTISALLHILRKQHQHELDHKHGYSLSYLDKLLAIAQPASQQLHNSQAVQVEITPPLLEDLSPREQEIMRLIIAGYSNREIADQLVIATSTVKTHINVIYGKLQVTRRTQAIARARALQLFPD